MDINTLINLFYILVDIVVYKIFTPLFCVFIYFLIVQQSFRWWENKKFELTGKNQDLDAAAKKFKIIIYFYSWIIVVEFFIIGISFLFSYYTSNLFQVSAIPEFVSVHHLKNFIFVQNSTNTSVASLENLSLLFSLFSIIVLYSYFFYILSKQKLGRELSENREKYIVPFLDIFLIAVIVAFFVIGADFSSPTIDQSRIVKDILLYSFGTFNFLTGPIIPLNFKPSYNKYEFIDSLRKMPTTDIEDYTSGSIFLSILILAVFAYFFDFNFVLLLYVVCVLLITQYWFSQIRLLPKEKMNLEFHERENSNLKGLTDVFILGKTKNDCFIVLDRENNVTYIMKNAILRIIPQK